MAKIKYSKEYFPADNASDARGAWYIACTDGYLHSDGIVRDSTRNKEIYTGYFSTYGEASFILNKYRNIKW